MLAKQRFQSYVARLKVLDEGEKSDVIALLEQVKALHEIPAMTPKGVQGMEMEANVAEGTISRKGGGKGKKQRLLLVCIPYLYLTSYSPEIPSNSTHLHPLKSLLQSKYSGVSKQRDLRQVVCELRLPQKGHCFHIPQLWCLVISDSTQHQSCASSYVKFAALLIAQRTVDNMRTSAYI